ncbi:unnamed protein product [Prunus brigantina]
MPQRGKLCLCAQMEEKKPSAQRAFTCLICRRRLSRCRGVVLARGRR